MNKTKILLFSVLSMLVIMSSCKKDDPVEVNEAEVLIDYLESNANTNIATLPSYVTVPSAVTKAGLTPILNDLMNTGVYIIDVRGATDYANGHIAGAVNVDISDGESVLEHVADNIGTIGDDPIVIVCYSGQSAAFEAALVKLAGYSNVSSLLFGMCGWKDGIHDNWNNAVASDVINVPDTDPHSVGSEFDLPNLNTGEETGEAILMERLMAVEAAGFGAIATSGDMTLSNSGTWYIMNYWPEAHYDMMHIDNAIMFEFGADTNPFTRAGSLMTIPTDGTSVVYCYTGQTSAWVATYLQVIGYNTKTMTYGVNGIWGKSEDNKMPGTRWLDYKDSHNLNGALHNDDK